MTVASPNLFESRSLSGYLKSAVEARKQANPRFSYGTLAKKLGLKSTATMNMIVNGQRLPSQELLERIVDYFGLSEREADFLENLVRSEKAKNDPRLQTMIDEKIAMNRPKGEFKRIERAQIESVTKWFSYAIREMVTMAGFQEDSKWISERLAYEVTPKDVETAIERLLEVGLLSRDSNGRLVQGVQCVDTPTDIVSEGLKVFHEESLGNTKKAIRAFPVEEREMTGTTITVSRKKMAKAKALIRDFQKQFIDIMEESDGTGDAVYELKILYYPLTRLGDEK